MNVAYVRVSTVDQNEERQLKALEPCGIEKIFMEKVSGKSRDREQLQLALDFVREGDSFFVEELSRLARNARDLLEIVELLEGKKVRLVSLKENIDTGTATGKLILTMLGAIAEFERANLLERQREGIAIAKGKGVYKGRKKTEIKDFGEYYERYRRRELTKAQVAELLKISRPTLNRMIKEYLEKQAEKNPREAHIFRELGKGLFRGRGKST